MKHEENPGGSNIVTLLIVGVVGYVGYQYLVSSGMWAQWFGGAASASGLPTINTIAAGLQSGAFVGAGTNAQGNTVVHQVATGAYYAVNPTSGAVSGASGPGTLAVGAPTTVPTQPVVPSSTLTGTLANQLQALANQYMANMQTAGTPVSGLNVDQWLYYYQLYKGVTVTPNQAESIIVAAGLTDATRGTILPLAQFLTALGSVGLSGIVSTPGQGPIRSPLPTTQNFGGGYGGYGNAGRRGYLN